MKIGILTFHFAINYGAVLQCYALQETLHELGYKDVEIINWGGYDWHLLIQRIPRRLSVDAIRKIVIKYRHFYSADNVFKNFVGNFLVCSQKIHTQREFSNYINKYDLIIVGSDQVWAPEYHGFSPYFLNGLPVYKGKRVAYAPCCRHNKVKASSFAVLRAALTDFDHLSARDQETRNFIYDLIGETVPLVPDPTILHDFNDIAGSTPIRKERYAFVYILGDEIHGGNKLAINRIRRIYPGLIIITATLSKTNPIYTSWADETYYDVSPIEWINLIKFSKFVFTDSFHGTIFSMKFGVPFLAYYSMEERRPRFDDLINRFGIGNRVIGDANQIRLVEDTLSNIDSNFACMKREGVEFLKKALN